MVYVIVLYEFFFLRTFHGERLPLVTHYGALVGLCEMGQETIEELVFPIIRTLGDRIVKLCENPSLSSIDKIIIDRINNVISKYIPTAYRASRPSPDDLEHFKKMNLGIIMDIVCIHMSLNFVNKQDHHLILRKIVNFLHHLVQDLVHQKFYLVKHLHHHIIQMPVQVLHHDLRHVQ